MNIIIFLYVIFLCESLFHPKIKYDTKKIIICLSCNWCYKGSMISFNFSHLVHFK